MQRKNLEQIYKLLLERFGRQGWWPGETRFEIIVGAVLTQNTNWKNVERAIANLKEAGCMTPAGLKQLEIGELAELIRPAGYYNIKAKRLKNFIGWLFDNYEGRLEHVEQSATEQLRGRLLSINGIGRETADSILLYAFGRAVFVIDAYTARVAFRHNLAYPDSDYEMLQELFASNLPNDAELFNEYHALFVELGKRYCSRRKPKCTGCPLEHLPHTLEPEYY